MLGTAEEQRSTGHTISMTHLILAHRSLHEFWRHLKARRLLRPPTCSQFTYYLILWSCSALSAMGVLWIPCRTGITRNFHRCPSTDAREVNVVTLGSPATRCVKIPLAFAGNVVSIMSTRTSKPQKFIMAVATTLHSEIHRRVSHLWFWPVPFMAGEVGHT